MLQKSLKFKWKLLFNEDTGEQGEENKNPPEEGKENEFIEEAEAIQKMKKENEKLKLENNKLLEAQKTYYNKVLNENEIPKGEPEPSKEDLKKRYEELAKSLVTNPTEKTNREIAELAVELADVSKKLGLQNPFLPKITSANKKAKPVTLDEKASAKNTEDFLKEALEESKENDRAFETYLETELD